MPITKPGPVARQFQGIKETLNGRRAAINELSFTYRQLQRLLPNIARRVDVEPLRLILQKQDEEDREIRTRLLEVASDHGFPPGPSSCEDANALLENMYHAERSAGDRYARAVAVVHTLKLVRTHLIRSWGRLISSLATEGSDALLQAAHALQAREADLFRELVALGEQVEQAFRPSAMPHLAPAGEAVDPRPLA